MKTRYAILEPGPAIETDEPVEASRLATLEWIDVEFEQALRREQESARRMVRHPDEVSPIDMRALARVLDPLFPDSDWERVAVNSFKGAADMFVGDGSARPDVPVNQLATLVYWTASILHEIDKEGVGLKTYDDMRKLALIRAAERLTSCAPPQSTTLAGLGGWAEVPRIHGRAVLFDDRVWF